MILTLSNPISLPGTLFIFIHFMASSDFLLFNSSRMASLMKTETLKPSSSMSFLTFSGTRTAMTTVFSKCFHQLLLFCLQKYKHIGNVKHLLAELENPVGVIVDIVRKIGES